LAKQNPYITHYVKRGDQHIYAREFGQHNPGSAIILMHGFPDSLHLYDRLIPLLTEKRRVIAFDFLGWGDSDKPKQHTYDTNSLLEDLNAVIDHFQMQHVILVAHDASGFPAIDWALEHPQRTDTLILLNTLYHPMKSAKPPEAIALFSTPSLRRNLQRWGANQSDALWQKGLIAQTSKFYSHPEVREKFVKIFAQQALAIRPAFFGLNNVLRDEIRQREQKRSMMQAFDRPVAIIFGADDPYLNTSVAQEFKDIFNNSHLTIVDKAGHYVQLDEPNAVAKAIFSRLEVKTHPLVKQ